MWFRVGNGRRTMFGNQGSFLVIRVGKVRELKIVLRVLGVDRFTQRMVACW